MGRQISQKRIIDATLAGVEKAQRFYEDASGDNWLWEGPEYLLVVHVAKALHKLEGAKYCTLESNVHATLKDAQAVTLGAPPKRLRHKGRFDLVLWWGNGAPRAAFEFKNQVYSYAQIAHDVARIEGVVERNAESSSFQFGAIVFYTSCLESTRNSAGDKLNARVDHLYKELKTHVSAKAITDLHKGKIHTEGDSAWCAVCITLRR